MGEVEETGYPRCVAWLVTGGAGYVGASVVRELLGRNRPVVVLDDLHTGDPHNVPSRVPFVRASVTDVNAVRRTLRDYGVTGVVHLAGRKSAVESQAEPLTYYQQNVGGTLALIRAMADARVNQLVLASSAAVYGAPTAEVVSEDTVPRPLHPYGETKLMAERIVRDAARVHRVRCVVLRYFNVAGAMPGGRLCRSDVGLLARTLDAVASGLPPVIFGRDYPTPDGSCIRDFVHVLDVAAAHALAVDALAAGSPGGLYNVGCGVGHSVAQVLDGIRRVTGIDVTARTERPRPGDPARVVASIDKIRRELGWSPRYGLADMVRSRWEAGRAERMRGPAPRGAPRMRSPAPRAAAAPATPSAARTAGNGQRIDDPPARVVVVSASVGAGHDGAARELTARLNQRGFQVDYVDLLSVFPRWLATSLRDVYRDVLDRRPWIYSVLFRLACQVRGAAPITRMLLRPMRWRLLRHLPADAQVAVAMYPLAAQLLGPLRRSGHLAAPVVTYLTDFAVHPIWVAPGISVHCAAHEVSRAQAVRLGAGDVRVAGRLVSAAFREEPESGKGQARQRLGLPQAQRLALLVAGSWGVGEVAATAAEVAATGAAVPVVVCGSNTELRHRLREQGVENVFGWVEDMPGLLHAVDVLVENAGGLTAMEAMACGVPVATYRPIAGHGTANAKAMARAGVTRWVRHPDALGPTLAELAEAGPDAPQRQAGLALFGTDPAGVVADLVKARGPDRAGDPAGGLAG